jgi:hypothetical protein
MRLETLDQFEPNGFKIMLSGTLTWVSAWAAGVYGMFADFATGLDALKVAGVTAAIVGVALQIARHIREGHEAKLRMKQTRMEIADLSARTGLDPTQFEDSGK